MISCGLMFLQSLVEISSIDSEVVSANNGEI
jgi:hypothetical protein